MLGYYLQFRSLCLETYYGGIHPTANGSSLGFIFFPLVHQFFFYLLTLISYSCSCVFAAPKSFSVQCLFSSLLLWNLWSGWYYLLQQYSLPISTPIYYNNQLLHRNCCFGLCLLTILLHPYM
jgi:hypothetical protein